MVTIMNRNGENTDCKKRLLAVLIAVILTMQAPFAQKDLVVTAAAEAAAVADEDRSDSGNTDGNTDREVDKDEDRAAEKDEDRADEKDEDQTAEKDEDRADAGDTVGAVMKEKDRKKQYAGDSGEAEQGNEQTEDRSGETAEEKNGARAEEKNEAKTEEKSGAKAEEKNEAKTEEKNGAKTEVKSGAQDEDHTEDKYGEQSRGKIEGVSEAPDKTPADKSSVDKTPADKSSGETDKTGEARKQAAPDAVRSDAGRAGEKVSVPEKEDSSLRGVNEEDVKAPADIVNAQTENLDVDGEGTISDQEPPEAEILIDKKETQTDEKGICHYKTADLKKANVKFTASGSGKLHRVSVVLVRNKKAEIKNVYEISKEGEEKEVSRSLKDVIGSDESMGDGVWTIYAYAEDTEGNKTGNADGPGDGEKLLDTVIVDDTAPVPVLDAAGPVPEEGTTGVKNGGNTYYNGSVTVFAGIPKESAEAENEKLTWSARSGAQTVPETNRWTISPSGRNVTEALPEIVFTVSDLAGNTGELIFQKSGEEQYYFDLQEPAIYYTGSDRGKLTIAEGREDFEYVISVDDGTISCGLDPASVQYAVVNSDDAAAQPEEKDWRNAGAEEKDGVCIFTVRAPKKGLVHIRACDRLGNGPAEETANTLVMEKNAPQITSITVEAEGTVETEEGKKKRIFCGDALQQTMEMTVPARGFSVSVDAEDSPADAYSGLKSVTYRLEGRSGGQTDFSSSRTIELSAEIPRILRDLKKEIRGEKTDLKELFGLDDTFTGEFELSVIVMDHCGNVSGEKRIRLEFDNTPPEISVSIDPAALEEYRTYHRADNSAVIVTIREKNICGYEISVGEKVNVTDRDPQGSTAEKSGDGLVTTVTIPTDAVAANEDGEVRITASVTDMTGAAADSFSDRDWCVYLAGKGSGEAVFTLDKKEPAVTLEYLIPDGRTVFVYDDQTGAGNVLTAYISGKTAVKAAVEEDNFDPALFFYRNPGGEAVKWEKDSVDLATAESDGQYLYGVYGTDMAGNPASVTERFAEGSNLEKKYKDSTDSPSRVTDAGADYAPYYAIVIDTTSPEVTKIETTDIGGEGSMPSFYEDDRTFYYKSAAGIQTVFMIEEMNFDSARICSSCRFNGKEIKYGPQEKDSAYMMSFAEDGIWADVTLMGTDRAGNHLVTAKSPETAEKAGQNDAAVSVLREKDENGLRDTAVVLRYRRILDRQSPVAVMTHIIPDNTTAYLYSEQLKTPDAQKDGRAAVLYSKKILTTNIRVSDTYGTGEGAGAVLPDGTKLNIRKHFRRPGGSFAVSRAEQWEEAPGDTGPLTTEIRTTEEGCYFFSIDGTDRAGNPVIVRESLQTDKNKNAVVDKKTGHCDGAGPDPDVPGPYSSFYTLVYDCTAPAYHLSINNPSDPEESFDENTAVAYYGRSVSSIRAEYVVTEYNFDDERILAGITGRTSSGVNNIDGLYPGWTTPDVKGSAGEKDGLVTAKFALTVDVDGSSEGVYRFEIAGCDKAGNVLVPDDRQMRTNRSNAREDLASKTVAFKASKGMYWTQRKAVDVTAPEGVLKIRSGRDTKDNYYEVRFGAGGNTPLKYEPFRRETGAYVIVESEDCSPTTIRFSLRSRDSGRDTSYKEKNPFVSAGDHAYRNDNSRAVTVSGEQVFYLENILIRDRAGNVRANDPGSMYTMPVSGNVYLDVTAPDVTGIRDAESPQVRIIASGRFTRHEADGERYIYRPAGSALDLKVSVSDPGGEARSSGLREVEVEVRVGGRVVTDRVKLNGIPYTYSGGTDDSRVPLVYDINDASISIPTGSFAESNDILITVRARDNSGNCSVPSRDGGRLKLGIDTTAPKVEVNYHDIVEPQHERYFKAGRVAEIVVIDRNVDSEKIRIDTNIAVSGSFTAPHDNREEDGGGENGDGDRWVRTLRYDADGDYTLLISGTDALGNRISDIRWNGPAPNAFTVDKTSPVIRVILPPAVNTRDGVRYYDSAVTASIEILEHNFVEEKDDGLFRVDIKASGHGGAKAPAVPVRSGFVRSGADLYTSSVSCTQDGDYEITASYTDMAGNEAVAEGPVSEGPVSEGTATEGTAADGTVSEGAVPEEAAAEGQRGGNDTREAGSGRFTVDTSAPVLKMDPATFNVDEKTGEPKRDLACQIYTKKEFAPCVIINDINYDAEKSGFDIKVYGADFRVEDRIRKGGDEETGTYTIRFTNFEPDRSMDGVYRVTAVAADYANHVSTLEFTFSINRFGSTYLYADDTTERKVEDRCISETEEPLRILELSPVELGTHSVELFKDHTESTLTEGTQYTFESAKGSTRAGTDGEGHRVYVYSIAPEVYEEEGVYDFILTSSDAAGNENSTVLFRDGEIKDGAIAQTKFPIEFQVDKTVPVNRITGAERDREKFNVRQLEIIIYPEDYQTDIREVEVKVWEGRKNGTGAAENTEKYLHFREIGGEEDVEKLAQAHIYPIGDARKGIPVTLEERNTWQLLEVITTDLAGNISTDFRSGDGTENLPDTRRRFLVTKNPLIRFYYFKPAFYGAIAAAVLLPILFFFRRRRRRDA